MGTDNLWNGIESLRPLQAVLVEWALEIGADYEAGRAFLQPTLEQAKDYPCTARFRCPCQHHHITMHSPERIVATCECGCRPITLEPKDVIVFALDVPKLGEAIRQAFRFDAAVVGAVNGGSRTHRVGNWGAAQSPVFLMFAPDEAVFLKELAALFGVMPDPFILLTPTGANYTAAVEAVLRRHGCAHVPLARHLALEEAGRFTVTQPIDGILAEFERQRAERMEKGAMLTGIHRAITAVGETFQEMRTAKERLEQMQAEGLLRFVSTVDPRAFRLFCQVMRDGTIAKASRSLEMADSTLRVEMDGWSRRGNAYATMLDLVRWRKKVKGAVTVPLNDAIVHENARAADFEALLAEVFDDLLSMTENNWPDICDDLKERLRPHVRR